MGFALPSFSLFYQYNKNYTVTMVIGVTIGVITNKKCHDGEWNYKQMSKYDHAYDRANKAK